MYLKTLNLKNFRLFKELAFDFNTPVTVLVGENAQGKTTLLESIYFLSSAKSPRVERDEQLISKGESHFRVEGKLDSDNSLEIIVMQSEVGVRKKIMVNGVSRRLQDYTSNMAVVMFAPEDINLVTGSPSLRRYHIDLTLSQVDRQYKKNLSMYENVLINKNRLLKRIREGLAKKDELDFWRDQQLLLGALITSKREEFFTFINSIERKFGNFVYQYKPSIISAEKLKELEVREIESASSLIGPHRDDFCFLLNNEELDLYGSRGEQRTAVLDLKIAEVSFIEKVLGDRPILLLDDIFSELDNQHRKHVIDMTKMQQTIIATVEYDDYLKEELKSASCFFVESGQISEKVDR